MDPKAPLRPALFLDRDGTLNVEVDYLHRPEDAHLTPGAGAALARVNAFGIPVVVVTNQAGIGRGRYGWAEYEAVQARLRELLAEEGAHVDAAYACPYHEAGVDDYRVADHPDRKPNPGMLLRAAQDLGLDLTKSWMVGDKDVDLQAGRAVGCRVALVLTGYGKAFEHMAADLVAPDLARAIDGILEQWPPR